MSEEGSGGERGREGEMKEGRERQGEREWGEEGRVGERCRGREGVRNERGRESFWYRSVLENMM